MFHSAVRALNPWYFPQSHDKSGIAVLSCHSIIGRLCFLPCFHCASVFHLRNTTVKQRRQSRDKSGIVVLSRCSIIAPCSLHMLSLLLFSPAPFVCFYSRCYSSLIVSASRGSDLLLLVIYCEGFVSPPPTLVLSFSLSTCTIFSLLLHSSLRTMYVTWFIFLTTTATSEYLLTHLGHRRW